MIKCYLKIFLSASIFMTFFSVVFVFLSFSPHSFQSIFTLLFIFLLTEYNLTFSAFILIKNYLIRWHKTQKSHLIWLKKRIEKLFNKIYSMREKKNCKVIRKTAINHEKTVETVLSTKSIKMLSHRLSLL